METKIAELEREVARLRSQQRMDEAAAEQRASSAEFEAEQRQQELADRKAHLEMEAAVEAGRQRQKAESEYWANILQNCYLPAQGKLGEYSVCQRFLLGVQTEGSCSQCWHGRQNSFANIMDDYAGQPRFVCNGEIADVVPATYD